LLPSTNNHLRSQSVDSVLTTSSINYAKQIETQNTERLWAEQLEQEEQLSLSLQQNTSHGNNEADGPYLTTPGNSTSCAPTPPELELSVILYQANCYDLAKWLSQYLYFFSFRLLLRWSMGKYHMTVTESQRCDSGHVMVISHKKVTSHSHSM